MKSNAEPGDRAEIVLEFSPVSQSDFSFDDVFSLEFSDIFLSIQKDEGS
jgi:hypothetical protein